MLVTAQRYPAEPVTSQQSQQYPRIKASGCAHRLLEFGTQRRYTNETRRLKSQRKSVVTQRNNKSCHSDQLSRKSVSFRHRLRHSFVYMARLSAKIRRLAEICGLALVLNS
jgi:hypothetical protein